MQYRHFYCRYSFFSSFLFKNVQIKAAHVWILFNSLIYILEAVFLHFHLNKNFIQWIELNLYLYIFKVILVLT
jgi:hypothetical protein